MYQIFLYIMTLEVIPSSFLKSIKNVAGLYEIRIEDEGNIYRVFCCFDEGNLIILFSGFQKKTQKTPQGEIEKAKRIMKEYFEEKKG
ncbi:MAG: type II toxin-antitoxin system RelE/ParE family toxin [Bacteroidaceae bacterium]|nr:type II toxin-antitoxin system RelE/ParE family toxin [Bacteroidaceae bacterium]